MKRPPVRGPIPIGIALVVLIAIPATASGAPLAPEREAHQSRYSLGGSVLEAQGERSASGRFQLDAEVSVRADADAKLTSFGLTMGIAGYY